MGLPGHRRTSSHKHRRAAHFALTKVTLALDTKTGLTHRPHQAAPGAKEYNGIPIHIKGGDRRLKKMLEKTKMKASTEPAPQQTPAA